MGRTKTKGKGFLKGKYHPKRLQSIQRNIKKVVNERILNDNIINDSIVNDSIINDSILNESILNERVINGEILNESSLNGDSVERKEERVTTPRAQRYNKRNEDKLMKKNETKKKLPKRLQRKSIKKVFKKPLIPSTVTENTHFIGEVASIVDFASQVSCKNDGYKGQLILTHQNAQNLGGAVILDFICNNCSKPYIYVAKIS